jgi:hypothetical protein
MNIQQITKKIDKQKEMQIYQGNKSRSADRKLQMNETQLKLYTTDLNKVRFLSITCLSHA